MNKQAQVKIALAFWRSSDTEAQPVRNLTAAGLAHLGTSAMQGGTGAYTLARAGSVQGRQRIHDKIFEELVKRNPDVEFNYGPFADVIKQPAMVPPNYKHPLNREPMSREKFNIFGMTPPGERTGKIIKGYSTNAPILAHELGHAEQFRKGGLARLLLKANPLGKLTMFLGGAGAMSSDKDTARTAAILGSLGGTVTLANEIDASRRGKRLLNETLKDVGMSGKKFRRFGRGAFLGVPSYALAAASPTLVYQLSKKYKSDNA